MISSTGRCRRSSCLRTPQTRSHSHARSVHASTRSAAPCVTLNVVAPLSVIIMSSSGKKKKKKKEKKKDATASVAQTCTRETVSTASHNAVGITCQQAHARTHTHTERVKPRLLRCVSSLFFFFFAFSPSVTARQGQHVCRRASRRNSRQGTAHRDHRHLQVEAHGLFTRAD